MYNRKYHLIDSLGVLHSLNDTIPFLNIDEAPYYKKKKRYTGEIQRISFFGEFFMELSRNVEDFYLHDFSEFRIEVVLDKNGDWADYKVLSDNDYILEDNALEVLNKLSEYSEPARKDGVNIASKLDFSVIRDCKETKNGYSCTTYPKINSITHVIIEYENNQE